MNANLDKLEVICKGVVVKPAPAKQELTLVVPAMPLPAPGDAHPRRRSHVPGTSS